VIDSDSGADRFMSHCIGHILMYSLAPHSLLARQFALNPLRASMLPFEFM
jgi:hypothetical protein